MAIKDREINLFNMKLRITEEELSMTRAIMKDILNQSNKNAVILGARLAILKLRPYTQSTQAQTQNNNPTEREIRGEEKEVVGTEIVGVTRVDTEVEAGAVRGPIISTIELGSDTL